MKNIQLPIYLNRIEPFIHKNLIKVIVGQRRLGKSFFLRQINNLFESDYPEIPRVYINKEDLIMSGISNKEHGLTIFEVSTPPNNFTNGADCLPAKGAQDTSAPRTRKL